MPTPIYASQEQSLVIGQVNDAVKQMEAMTIQKARLAKHAEDESLPMRAQALKLAELVEAFRPSASAWQTLDAAKGRCRNSRTSGQA